MDINSLVLQYSFHHPFFFFKLYFGHFICFLRICLVILMESLKRTLQKMNKTAKFMKFYLSFLLIIYCFQFFTKIFR